VLPSGMCTRYGVGMLTLTMRAMVARRGAAAINRRRREREKHQIVDYDSSVDAEPKERSVDEFESVKLGGTSARRASYRRQRGGGL
jgi:hypothetical protein